MEALAFEVEDRVDDVLEHARSRDRALLRDVADEEDRHVIAFRDLEQAGRAFAQLRNATGGRADRVGGHRLDGIDHGEDRPHATDRLDDRAEIGLALHVDLAALDAEATGPQLDLRRGLLARYIKDVAPLGEGRGRLHQERALADPRVAAEQDARAAHDAAPEHTVELTDAGGDARLGVGGHVVQRDRRSGCACDTTTLRGCDHALLYQCVPAIA